MKTIFPPRRVVSLAMVALLLVLQSCTLLPAETALAPTTAPPPATNAPAVTLAPADTQSPTRQPSSTPEPATQVAAITPDAQVRRLSPAVFAGNSQPLPEITSDQAINLDAGGLVTTGAQGEAEVQIQGCLKLFIFQDVTLQRSACRREDAASGLAVCSAGGMTGVLNQCASLVDIQTPGSTTRTSGTWFSVIYLPDDHLSIVQVYEGAVNVSAAIDLGTNRWTSGAQLAAGNLWFTSPGEDAPVINGIQGREAQPMEVWQALRPELIAKYPHLDTWMESAKQKAGVENLAFPDFLAPPSGQIDLIYSGPQWKDTRVQRAMTIGADWKSLMQSNWFDFNITPRLLLPDNEVADGREIQFDRDEAIRLLSEADFWSQNPYINIVSRDGDFNANQFAYSLQTALQDLKISSEVFTVGEESFKVFREYSDPSFTTPFILLETSGDAFTQ